MIMKRQIKCRRFLTRAALAVSALAVPNLIPANAFGAAGTERPNIVLILADDLGFSELGCYGSEIRTPAIDRLASEGVGFSQFYVANCCGPSRAALNTCCYAWQVGQPPGANIFGNLTRNCVTLTQLLKANGYKTCVVGRLDMVTSDDWHDPAQIARCADRFLGSASGGAGNYFKEAKGTPWFKDGKRWQRPEGPYSTDLITDFVIQFIEGTAGDAQPFFVYFAHYAPHWPLQAKEEDVAHYRKLYEHTDRKALMQARLERQMAAGLIPAGTTLNPSMVNAAPAAKGCLAAERMAINAAMVTSFDRSVADVLAALKKAGKLDNTLLLVLSDNGAGNQIHCERKVADGVRPGSIETFLCQGPALAALANTPLNGYKMKDYEGGISSPLIAWWPRGVKNGGRLSHHVSHLTDIMATCLELAGATYPSEFEGRKIIPGAGRSLVSVLRDAADDTPRVLPWPKSLREGEWKLVLEKPATPELYRLSQDKGEQKNLAPDCPDRVREMRATHAAAIGKSGAR
jgi:arylsulfatase